MGILQKVNGQGYYQNYDTEKNVFIGEPIRPYREEIESNVSHSKINEESSIIAQNVTSVDQIEHQLILTEDGRSIDLDEKHFDIIDENGRIEFDADGKIIMSVAKEQLTGETFIRTYKESSKQAMLLLLALQSNAAPLKRGGIDIAYMTDILIDHMIVKFSEPAQALWEAIGAIQSSRPEDDKISIYIEDIEPYTAYKSYEALCHAFADGYEELRTTPLEFDIPDPKRDGHNITIPWNDGLEWFGNNKTTGERAHFDVYTNDFYRVLQSSSGILHGAHWNRRISRGLKGYARSLYIFCARNKNYTKYKGAIPGVKELTVAETRYELKIASVTAPAEINRKLTKAADKINKLPDSEFTVTVEKVPETGKIQGFKFIIKENRFIDTVATEIEINDTQAIEEQPVDDTLFIQIKTLFQISGISFTDDEIKRISNATLRYKKDPNYLMQIIPIFNNRLNNHNLDPIEDKVGYFCRMIEQGTNTAIDIKQNNKTNKFNNFDQRDYDMKELEKKLIGQ